MGLTASAVTAREFDIKTSSLHLTLRQLNKMKPEEMRLTIL